MCVYVGIRKIKKCFKLLSVEGDRNGEFVDFDRSRGGGELVFVVVMIGRYRGSPKKEFGGIVDLRRY